LPFTPRSGVHPGVGRDLITARGHHDRRSRPQRHRRYRVGPAPDGDACHRFCTRHFEPV